MRNDKHSQVKQAQENQLLLMLLGCWQEEKAQVTISDKGADKCILEGLLEWPKQDGFSALMNELGIESDGDNLIVRRDMSLTGKNICRVNGHIVTLANLRKIGSYLVDIQGQNEHQELLQPEAHLVLLDRFGDNEFQRKKKIIRKSFRATANLNGKVRKIQKNENLLSNGLTCFIFSKKKSLRHN